MTASRLPFSTSFSVFLVALALLLAGCASLRMANDDDDDDSSSDHDAGPDGGLDGGATDSDTPSESETPSDTEASTDTATDSETGSSSETTSDTGSDSASDSASDTGSDSDSASDTGSDSASDSASDSGSDSDSETVVDTDTTPTCPIGLVLATWNSSNEGWDFSGYWYVSSGKAAWGRASSSSSYDQSLTSGSDVDLSACMWSTLTFLVSLADDSAWASESSTDKNTRLYIECSGDSGVNWTSLSPPGNLPTTQSACGTFYCDGNYDAFSAVNRSFAQTSQTWNVAGACLTANARFRFRATGPNCWEINNPGWTVDTVTLN